MLNLRPMWQQALENKARRASGQPPRPPLFTLDEIGFEFGLSGLQISCLARRHPGKPAESRPRNNNTNSPALYAKGPVVAWLESIGKVRS